MNGWKEVTVVQSVARYQMISSSVCYATFLLDIEICLLDWRNNLTQSLRTPYISFEASNIIYIPVIHDTFKCAHSCVLELIYL